jgi:hypothetical protein
MLKLFVKDNRNGAIHEYGTDPHDSLLLMEDGSLHYEHMQCGDGTMFPEEGFSFCRADGTIPKTDEIYGGEPYIDIGGDYHKKHINKADRIRAMTDEELAKLLYEIDGLGYCKNLPECGELLDTEEGIPEEKCIGCMLQWLRQPPEIVVIDRKHPRADSGVRLIFIDYDPTKEDSQC